MSNETTNQDSGGSDTPEGQQRQEEYNANKMLIEDFKAVLEKISTQFQTGPPITVEAETPTDDEIKKKFMGFINDRLVGKIPIPSPRGERCIRPLSVAFPQCSDVMLSHVKIYETNETIDRKPQLKNDDITVYFDDYFMFCDHSIVFDDKRLNGLLDSDLLACTKTRFSQEEYKICDGEATNAQTATAASQNQELCPVHIRDLPPRWPSPWCLPPSCVTLAGNRHISTKPYDLATPPPSGSIKRLFIADTVWLFYFERMGIFKILGTILDDFATKGKIPISNGIVESGIQDDVIAIVLESMIRQTKIGLSSTVRDRDSSYRRCLGWTSDVGRKLGLDTVTNGGFNTLFHRFIQLALEFFKDKRLATAIVGITTSVSKTSVATLLTISDTLDLLKKAFDPFDYGRNYSNTLNGIAWVIAGMAMIRELRTTLGIPAAYDKAYEYIPAAYDLLVLRRPITPSGTNRYTVHRECANDARDILLDLEVVNHQDTAFGGELELWLNIIEDKVEGYRTAYRSLTGVDLGMPTAPGAPTIEQAV